MAVTLEHLPDYQGQPTWKITTSTATWFYHQTGAGFASLVDPDGDDWISFKPTGGSDGVYRGIPNCVHPDGGFHPGNPDCASRLVEESPERVVIESSKGDDWACTWTITDDEAVMRLTKIGHPYWILYEGTPPATTGGDYDEAATTWTDSAGTEHACTEEWEGRLPEPRTITFRTPGSRYELFLHDETPRSADVRDSFWSMEQNMTVLGLGRILDAQSDRWMHLTETPATFRVAIRSRS